MVLISGTSGNPLYPGLSTIVLNVWPPVLLAQIDQIPGNLILFRL